VMNRPSPPPKKEAEDKNQLKLFDNGD